MNRLVFVKLGGSLITDKTQRATARYDTIRRCARELVAARRAQPELRLLLAHGSGSFGHVAAVQSRFGRDGVMGYVETGAAAARLNRIVTDLCLEEGLPIVSLQPSASALCVDGKLVELATRPIELALQNNLVPLVFGDVSFDVTRGVAIASTEEIFAYLARRLQPARIVLVGQVDGVFTADPLRQPNAQRIPRLTPANFAALQATLGGSHGVDVTGGMLTKVQGMLDLARAQPTLRAHLISGETHGALTQALTSDHADSGTWIEA
jgi:isopentenyl phosphate kinase